MDVITNYSITDLFNATFDQYLSDQYTSLQITSVRRNRIIQIPHLSQLNDLPNPISFSLVPMNLFNFRTFNHSFIKVVLNPTSSNADLVHPLRDLNPFRILIINGTSFNFIQIVLKVPTGVRLYHVNAEYSEGLFMVNLSKVPINLPLLPIHVVKRNHPNHSLQHRKHVIPVFHDNGTPGEDRTRSDDSNYNYNFLVVIGLG